MNEEHVPVPLSFSYNTRKRIQINHYPIRSQQDFEEKLARGRADTDVKEYEYAPDAFHAHLNETTRPERSILRFAEKLHAMRQSRAPSRFHEISNRYPAAKSPARNSRTSSCGWSGKASTRKPRWHCAWLGSSTAPTRNTGFCGPLVARLGGKLEQALKYLRHSLLEVATPQAYHEMHHVLGRWEKHAEAKTVLRFTQFLIRHHGIEDKNLQSVVAHDLERLEKPFVKNRFNPRDTIRQAYTFSLA